METSFAVARLNSQLPLKARQERLPMELKVVHEMILTAFVSQGRPPARERLQEVLGGGDIDSAIQRLGGEDLIVLDQEKNSVLGAYPLTLEVTPHKIHVNGNDMYAMCALDAVSIAPMFNTEVMIDSVCHISQTPIWMHMSGDKILETSPNPEVMIGIRWQMPTAVAAHSMCMEMVFIGNTIQAMTWQQNDPVNLSLFSLPEAVEFGKRFFKPLLD